MTAFNDIRQHGLDHVWQSSSPVKLLFHTPPQLNNFQGWNSKLNVQRTELCDHLFANLWYLWNICFWKRSIFAKYLSYFPDLHLYDPKWVSERLSIFKLDFPSCVEKGSEKWHKSLKGISRWLPTYLPRCKKLDYLAVLNVYFVAGR